MNLLDLVDMLDNLDKSPSAVESRVTYRDPGFERRSIIALVAGASLPRTFEAITVRRLVPKAPDCWTGVEWAANDATFDVRHDGDTAELCLAAGAGQIVDVLAGGRVLRHWGSWLAGLADRHHLGTPYQHVVRFIAGNDSGIIRHGPRQLVPLLVEVLGAFRTVTVVILVGQAKTATGLRSALRKQVNRPIRPLNSQSDSVTGVDVIVGTAGELVNVQHRLCHDIHLVICADARVALDERSRQALDAAFRAKLFGCLPDSEQLDWLDEQKLTEAFGFAEVAILPNGLAPRPGTFFPIRFRGGRQLPPDLDPFALIRRGVLQNQRRNCRVVTTAREIWGGRYNPGIESCVVIAGDHQQALELHRRIRWPILSDGQPTRPRGYSSSQLTELQAARISWNLVEGPFIATVSQAPLVPLHTCDAIILAGGGKGLSATLLETLVQRAEESRPAQVFDFADEHHPVLARHALLRRKALASIGWTVNGPESIEDRIRRFLARRSRCR
jgi:hypothetical protein